MTFFYNLNKKLDGIAAKPESAQLNERDMGKHNNKTTGFKAVADKAAKEYGSKAAGERVAGAQFQKMKKAGKLEETDIEEGLGDVVKKVGSMAKKAGGAVLNKLGHGSDADMMRDLQKKMGMPPQHQHGKPGMAEPKEGNEFSGELQQARASGQKEFSVDGKTYPVKETEMTPKQKSFAALAEPKDKITFADKIAGAKKEVDEMLGDVAAEAMRNALGSKKVVADEGFPTVASARDEMQKRKVGDVTHGAKHDTQEIPGGRRVTRRLDPNTGYSVGAEDDKPADGEKRSRGRPKGAPKGPERVTANATKHKGGRKTNEGSDYGQAQQIYSDLADIRAVAKQAQGGGQFPQGFASRLEATLWAAMTLIKNQQGDGEQVREEELDEKATSKKQQKFMGMVHAAQKGEKPASKEVAKTAKTMGKKDAEDFASTKHKGLPEKKKSESKDSDADNKEDAPKKSKSKFKFGGSVYETLDAQLETLITEGMSVSINMSQNSEGGQPGNKSITVNADGEDADKLAELLKMAGMEQHSDSCPSCGASPCGCDMIDENNPNWPTDTETSDNALQYAGGLNGPKSTGQTTIPVLASQMRRQASMAESARVEQNLLNLYKTFGK
jgi:hypothetical protein